jgi:hypothetical protein
VSGRGSAVAAAAAAVSKRATLTFQAFGTATSGAAEVTLEQSPKPDWQPEVQWAVVLPKVGAFKSVEYKWHGSAGSRTTVPRTAAAVSKRTALALVLVCSA